LTGFKRHSAFLAKVINGHCYEDFCIFKDSLGSQNVLGLVSFGVCFLFFFFLNTVNPYLLQLSYMTKHTSVLRDLWNWNFRRLI